MTRKYIFNHNDGPNRVRNIGEYRHCCTIAENYKTKLWQWNTYSRMTFLELHVLYYNMYKGQWRFCRSKFEKNSVDFQNEQLHDSRDDKLFNNSKNRQIQHLFYISACVNYSIKVLREINFIKLSIYCYYLYLVFYTYMQSTHVLGSWISVSAA